MGSCDVQKNRLYPQWHYRAIAIMPRFKILKKIGDKMTDEEKTEEVKTDPPEEEREPNNQDDTSDQPDPQPEEKKEPEDNGLEKRISSLEQSIREIRAMMDALGIDDDDKTDMKTAEDTATDGDSDGDGEPDPTDITIEDLFETKK